MEYYVAIKNEILCVVTAWVDLEGVMLSEISQPRNDKFHMILFLCGI